MIGLARTPRRHEKPQGCRGRWWRHPGWKRRGTRVGMAQRHRHWFRAPARCRPEVGVPSRPRDSAPGGGTRFRAPPPEQTPVSAYHPCSGTRNRNRDTDRIRILKEPNPPRNSCISTDSARFRAESHRFPALCPKSAELLFRSDPAAGIGVITQAPALSPKLGTVPARALGEPSGRRSISERENNKWQRTSGSLPAISGESVKGGNPLSQSITTNRNSPPRGAQGSCDCRREAPGGPKGGSPAIHADDTPPTKPSPLPDRST